MISLRQLRYFRGIATEGSLSAAARALGVAQPALSYHLGELEQDLGIALVERSNRGVRLTDAGRRLWAHADAILHRVEEAEIDVCAIARQPHGTVSLSLPATMAGRLAPPLLRLVADRYPLVTLVLIDLPSFQAMQQLESGRIDLSLLPNAAQIEGIEVEPIYREPISFVRLRAEGERPPPTIRFADMGDTVITMLPRTFDLRLRVEDAALTANHRLNIQFEQVTTELIRALVLSGIAATITQAAFFDPKLERPLLDIRRIVEPEVSRVHALTWLESRPLTLAGQAIRSALRSLIVELSENGDLPGEVIPAVGADRRRHSEAGSQASPGGTPARRPS